MKVEYNLTEAIDGYNDFIINNSIEVSKGCYEIIMDDIKIKDHKFLLENFNHCFSEYGNKLKEIAEYDENIKFNGKLDSVYKILQRFVKDKCFDSDFSMLSDDQTMKVLKTWWNENKYKFKG